MGKPTGFIEHARSAEMVRPALDRLADWREFHRHSNENELRNQSGRCMDCSVPFCHTGNVLGGTASGCPINNLIPEWNDLVYHGRWREAFERLRQTNNFPEFTGRVCPAPCEGSCVLAIDDQPVTIKRIEHAIIEHAFEAGWVVPQRPTSRTGKRVAIVGSGPAGLAAADQLNRAGHSITVFERADRIGGLLMYGIPNMKLDKSVVQRRTNLLAAEGVEFVINTNVGRDYSADRLMQEFDATILCGGATRPRDLTVAGRSLSGIHFAMDFLQHNTKNLLDRKHEDGCHLSAKNKDVIVIGGGDTGTDCVGTALRQGCKSLVQFEILNKPPDTRASNNPWPQWPNVYRLDYGQEEAAALFGREPRTYSIMTKSFVGNKEQQVAGVRTVEINWSKDANQSFRPLELPGTERKWPAQLILLALGFEGPETDGLINQLGVKLDARGNVATDENKMTSVPMVFAAGDMARGQSLVVWAIADGRRAARGADKFLQLQLSPPQL